MAKYKFPQFNIEIENPTISIDMTSIKDNAIDKLLSISIALQTLSTKIYGVELSDMPYEGNWIDEDIEPMVMQKLTEFEV